MKNPAIGFRRNGPLSTNEHERQADAAMRFDDRLSPEVAALPVCIVGAGCSGVTAAKALKEKGVAFDCFELGSKIGGMWRYENDNGMSSAYRSLHIDTSRTNLGYSDFPIIPISCRTTR